MDTQLGATELDYLRNKHPHVSRLYMSIHMPEVIYVGAVDTVLDRGSRIFEVSTVSGEYTSIRQDMTVYVGATIGDSSKSVRRVRNAVDMGGGRIRLTLDENSVVWEITDVLTIYRSWDIFPKYPYIDPDDLTFYKDRDIPYTDQNRHPNPVVVMGSDQVKFYDPDAGYNFLLDGSDSYTLFPTTVIESYLWQSETPGGIFSHPNAAITTVLFPAPGQYWVSLIITDSEGKTHVGRRLLFLETPDSVFSDFEFKSPMTGDWRKGGWSASIEVKSTASLVQFPRNATVVIWGDSYYNGLYLQIDKNILLAGFLQGGSVSRNIETGSVTFTVNTIEKLLQRHMMYSVSLTDSTDPQTWYEYYQLTIAKAVHHLYDHHSTLLARADVYLPIDNELRLPAVDDFSNGDLYKIVDTFTHKHGIFAHLVSNRRSQLFLEIDLDMESAAVRDSTVIVMELTEADMRGDTNFQFQNDPMTQVSLVDSSGIIYDGTDSTAIFSRAPGNVPDVDGLEIVTLTRQLFASQEDANERTGRILAILNKPIQDLIIPLAGNYGFIDIVPQRWYTLNLPLDFTKRNIAIQGRAVPRTVTNEWTVGALMTQLVVDIEAVSNIGITVPPPPVPPTPPYVPPPPPIVPPPPPNEGEGFGTVYSMTNTLLARTRNFGAITPNWVEIGPTFPNLLLYDFILDPWSPETTGYCLTTKGLYKSTNLETASPSWSLVLDLDDLPAITTAAGIGTHTWHGNGARVLGTIHQNGYVAVIHPTNNGVSAVCTFSENGGASWDAGLIVTGLDNIPYISGCVADVQGSPPGRLFSAYNVEDGPDNYIGIASSANFGASWGITVTPVSVPATGSKNWFSDFVVSEIDDWVNMQAGNFRTDLPQLGDSTSYRQAAVTGDIRRLIYSDGTPFTITTVGYGYFNVINANLRVIRQTDNLQIYSGNYAGDIASSPRTHNIVPSEAGCYWIIIPSPSTQWTRIYSLEVQGAAYIINNDPLLCGPQVSDQGSRVVHTPYNDNSPSFPPTKIYVSLDSIAGYSENGLENLASLPFPTGAKGGLSTYTQDRLKVVLWDEASVMHVSNDGGETWSPTAMSGITGNIKAAGGFPFNGDQYYALTDTGIYVTTDSGATWINKTGDWAWAFNFATMAPAFGADITPLWTE